jgi:D-aminopeptidase
MASGDDQLCAEARALLPELTTCVTKHGLACQQAWLLPKAVAHQRLEDSAAAAVRRALTGTPPEPYRISKPVTIRVELVERRRIPNPIARPGITLIDGRTYEFTATTVEQALLAVF